MADGSGVPPGEVKITTQQPIADLQHPSVHGSEMGR
jgi:hypothetical protein